MKHVAILSTALMVVFGACSQIDEIRYGEVRQITIHQSEAYTDSPDITCLHTGEFLMVFRDASEDAGDDGKIMLCRSANGELWSVPDTVVSTAWDCRNPSVSQMQDGLILINFYQSRDDTQGESLGSVGCYTVRSFDQGRTFTAPRMVRITGLDNRTVADAVLEMDDGSLLMPVYGQREGGSSSVWVVISRDGGETWSESHLVAEDPEGQIHFYKPALSVLPDGGLLCMLETDNAGGFLYRSISDDGGLTWSNPMPTQIQGEAPDLLLTQFGTLLCAYRDDWPRGTSFVRSYDGGRTWERETLLFGTEYRMGYPSLAEVGENILAVYDAKLKEGRGSGLRATLFRAGRPERPKGFAAEMRDDGCVHLRWNGVRDAAYYMVYRDTIPDFTLVYGYPRQGNGIATPMKTSYTDVQADTGRVHYYRVTAVAGQGELLPGTGSESEPTEALRVISNENE